jgi:hypothetical protein
MDELVPSFMIPRVDIVPTTKVEYLEEHIISEKVDARFGSYSLDR